MNKLLVALIAGAFATVAAAQTAPPKLTTKERQQAVSGTTQTQTDSDSAQKTAAEQKANVRASKEVSKMTAAEKKAFIEALNKESINPNAGPGGGIAGTAAAQKANTMESKEMPKASAQFKTKEGKKELSQGLEKASQGGR
jgi:hypothetical protein